MTIKPIIIPILSIWILTSCQSKTATKQVVDTSQSASVANDSGPNYNYVIDVPKGWAVSDTIINGLKIRFLLASQSLRTDRPLGNIIISSMDGQSLTDFTTKNISYLKANMPGIVILERGNIESSMYKGQWFTYTKEQNGEVRDMINYIIPLKGYAYMITCGSAKGTIGKYRAIFDGIVKSLKG